MERFKALKYNNKHHNNAMSIYIKNDGRRQIRFSNTKIEWNPNGNIKIPPQCSPPNNSNLNVIKTPLNTFPLLHNWKHPLPNALPYPQPTITWSTSKYYQWHFRAKIFQPVHPY
jgi:hypothetical protein